MSLDASYQHAIPAIVDLYPQTGRLNTIILMSLHRVFFVTLDGGSIYPGIFRYNQEQDMNGFGTATIGISNDNKLTVTMKRDGDMQPIALFTSMDDVVPELQAQKENVGKWRDVIPISQSISKPEDLKSKEDMVAKQTPPDVPDELRQKRRWLQPIIRNETDFKIKMTGSYFRLGRYDQTPSPRLASFSMDAFTACVADGTVVSGVGGATTYQISMGNTHQFDFGIGYSTPFVGPNKVGLLATNDPKKACDATTSPVCSLTTTETYVAKEEGSGKTVFFRLHISATAGQKPEFIITEDRFNSVE